MSLIRRRAALWVAILAAVALLAAACTGDNPDEPDAGADPDEADDDQDAGPGDDGPGDAPATTDLIIDKSFNQTSADPHRDNTTTGRMLLAAMYETLVRLTPDGELDPGLAETFDANDDATEFTFHLNEAAVFSDGTPVTADDVVFSINRLRNIQGPGAWMVENITATAADDHTVVLTTDSSSPEVPYVLTNPQVAIVNAELLRDNGGTDAEDASTADEAEPFLNQNSAGSAPYVLERFSTETEVVFAANEHYWGDDPGYRQLIVRNSDPPVQRFNIVGGQSHLVLDLTADELIGMEDHEHIELVRGIGASVFYTQANADSSVSDIASNPDFWEAVRYAIDYEDVLGLAGEGARQACGMIPSQIVGALGDDECVSRDLDRAQAALERAGLENPSVELEFSTTAFLDGIAHGDVAQRIQSQLADAGIEVTVRGFAHATALDRWRSAVSEMGQWSISIRYADPSSYLVLAPGGDQAMRAAWDTDHAPDIAELAEQARTTASDEERLPLYEEFQRRLNEESPFFPLFQAPRIFVSDGTVSGVASHPTLIQDLTTLAP